MHDEGLRATYRIQRPPWLGLWTGTEHKGRPEWWTEANYKSDGSEKGLFRVFAPRFNEENVDWFDPKVKDGTSLAGPLGMDSKKHKNLTLKCDTPGDLKSFQENVYRNSIQYKNIAEKFNLSKEHPGLAINPTLNSYHLTTKDNLGRSPVVRNRFSHLGPRFFDKPLNEGTLEKGLASAKYAAIFMLPITLVKISSFGGDRPLNLKLGYFLKHYFKNLPIPLTAAFTWGSMLSAAAVIRNRDDCQNHLFSSAAVGCVVGTMKSNFSIGLTTAAVSLVLGVFWQYQRWSKDGLQGMVLHQSISGSQAGPLAWQLLDFGDHEVPQQQY
uniref:NADH dehydrogenase [ubiquinone] 1 alpha subcomplex subunit 11 n=1 Tax=Strongyloides stercoralis TaxID=6248 RepID=A0A0K0EKN6_STRER